MLCVRVSGKGEQQGSECTQCTRVTRSSAQKLNTRDDMKFVNLLIAAREVGMWWKIKKKKN